MYIHVEADTAALSMSGRESARSVKSPEEAFGYTEFDSSGYGLRRARAWQTISAPSGGPGPIGRPASSHACPASKDTHVRASAKHHARVIMPQARQSSGLSLIRLEMRDCADGGLAYVHKLCE